MPNEPIKGLNTPNTGDLVGAWGTTAVNANMQAVGGMLGGVTTIALSSGTTFSLSVPSGSITPGAGPNQSQNALIIFSGVLTGNCGIKFTLPGSYAVENRCANVFGPGGFIIQLQPSAGTGNVICAPPGRKTTVFYDGIDMDYVNPPDVGTAIDLHGTTGLPAWMVNCTRPYALIKDGASYSTNSFPALFLTIGYAFGGSGPSFNVPDERSRMRLPIDLGGTSRVTAGVSGINGASMGAAGGDEHSQSHAHTGSGNVSDPQHSHSEQGTNSSVGGFPNISAFPAGGNVSIVGTQGTLPSSTGVTVPSLNINPSGAGNSQNMPPAIVSFLALIKT